MQYATPSLDSEDLAYLTPPTATILVSTIKEIMGISQTVMFPDGYSGSISTWADDDCVNQSFQDMASWFSRLEEFEGQGSTEVSQ